MIRKVAFTIFALMLAVFLGWLLAEPESATGRFNGSEAFSLPNTNPASDVGSLEHSLETLYQRSAWSAVSPEDVESIDVEAEQAPLPEGLDRFRLLGILRVSGLEAEVLLKDLNADEDEQTVFRAMEGDDLQNSGVVLAEIGQQKIYLEQAGEMRELFLFPRSPTNGREE